MQSNAAKRVRAFNPSRYERAFDVRLVLSGKQATLGLPWTLQGEKAGERKAIKFFGQDFNVLYIKQYNTETGYLRLTLDSTRRESRREETHQIL